MGWFSFPREMELEFLLSGSDQPTGSFETVLAIGQQDDGHVERLSRTTADIAGPREPRSAILRPD